MVIGNRTYPLSKNCSKQLGHKLHKICLALGEGKYQGLRVPKINIEVEINGVKVKLLLLLHDIHVSTTTSTQLRFCGEIIKYDCESFLAIRTMSMQHDFHCDSPIYVYGDNHNIGPIEFIEFRPVPKIC